MVTIGLADRAGGQMGLGVDMGLGGIRLVRLRLWAPEGR